MIDKFRELRRRRKRKYEARRLREQGKLLAAKKETLRKLDAIGRCPQWVKEIKLEQREPTAYEKARYKY